MILCPGKQPGENGEQRSGDRVGSEDGEVALAPTAGGYHADVVNRLETSPRAEFETDLPIIDGLPEDPGPLGATS